MRRSGEVDELLGAVMWLSNDELLALVTGTMLQVNGGSWPAGGVTVTEFDRLSSNLVLSNSSDG